MYLSEVLLPSMNWCMRFITMRKQVHICIHQFDFQSGTRLNKNLSSKSSIFLPSNWNSTYSTMIERDRLSICMFAYCIFRAQPPLYDSWIIFCSFQIFVHKLHVIVLGSRFKYVILIEPYNNSRIPHRFFMLHEILTGIFTKWRSLCEEPYVCDKHSAKVLVTLVGFVTLTKFSTGLEL